jgi:hypothetical protein
MSIATSRPPAEGGIQIRQQDPAAARGDGARTSWRAPAGIAAGNASIPAAIRAAEKRDE